MRWLVDTSAWSRRRIPEVAAQLAALLDEAPDNELALSGPVLLELLTEPQGANVATTETTLREAAEILAPDDETIRLAAQMMANLAQAGTDFHRRPIADLLTAALAHQHDCGLVHVDSDFELIAQHGGLAFTQRRLELPESNGAPHPATSQRALKRELHQLLHQLPINTAETLLKQAIVDAQRHVADNS
ncbi:MAG TPA: PIN domain-containing protein [Baekduia sp.]|uniref:PIN domain-containing protein n=1 Tax=Baekduia sp. TaxID=2600305 RepID=UPI002D779464|nr:PIN domain-containing protein [Baekduia sp.]HET6508211.1 PIN domain-containing protein [Baekduia sp.]